MKTTRDFRPLSDRYAFDCGPCSYANGFARIDTKQDAPWFSHWRSPAERTIVGGTAGHISSKAALTRAILKSRRSLAFPAVWFVWC